VKGYVLFLFAGEAEARVDDKSGQVVEQGSGYFVARRAGEEDLLLAWENHVGRMLVGMNACTTWGW
jgi:hypothetical protein